MSENCFCPGNHLIILIIHFLNSITKYFLPKIVLCSQIASVFVTRVKMYSLQYINFNLEIIFPFQITFFFL